MQFYINYWHIFVAALSHVAGLVVTYIWPLSLHLLSKIDSRSCWLVGSEIRGEQGSKYCCVSLHNDTHFNEKGGMTHSNNHYLNELWYLDVVSFFGSPVTEVLPNNQHPNSSSSSHHRPLILYIVNVMTRIQTRAFRPCHCFVECIVGQIVNSAREYDDIWLVPIRDWYV